MTEAAVAGLTRGLARDLGPRGITVNTVQPGPVDTDMSPADGPFAESIKGWMALGRYGLGSALHVMLALCRSSRQVVVADEELYGTNMVRELLGKRQRLTY